MLTAYQSCANVISTAAPLSETDPALSVDRSSSALASICTASNARCFFAAVAAVLVLRCVHATNADCFSVFSPRFSSPPFLSRFATYAAFGVCLPSPPSLTVPPTPLVPLPPCRSRRRSQWTHATSVADSMSSRLCSHIRASCATSLLERISTRGQLVSGTAI